MRPSATLIALTAFVAAAGLAFLTAVFAATAIEARATRLVERALARDGIGWASVATDGLTVTLTGTAPSEALRFRAIGVAGGVVGAGRIVDALEVTPPGALAPPAFGIEFLRNDDGVSLIGLVPEGWDMAATLAAAGRAADGMPVTDMIQTAAHAAPPGWQAAVDYGLQALALVPRAKISVAPGRVAVSAIADTAAQKAQLETALARAVPLGNPPLVLHVDIAAPRPVITPFTLRFVIDEAGARFDACSAASERGRTRIIAAGVAAGAAGKIDCTLGLGAPSPRWADAAEAGLAALARLGAGTLTMSDTDISLIVPHTVAAAAFERVTGDLGSALPDVFSLRATRLDPPEAARVVAAAQFTATRSLDGTVELRGRIADDRLRGVAEALARARFGAGAVNAALRVDPEGLPEGWSLRVLAAIAALAVLDEGAALVDGDTMTVRGRSGDAQARGEVTRILAAQLGQGALWTVDVAYDAALDPNPPPLAPEACVAEANGVLAQGKIAFAPGASDIPESARPALDALAGILRRCAGVAIEIGGHTDSQGRAETNLTLSEARAEAVRRALMARRVPVEAITARGYGAAEPVAPNNTEAGREANRRIAFRLLAAPDGAAAPGVGADAPGGDTSGDDASGAETSGADAPAGATAPARASGEDAPAPVRPEARPEGLLAAAAEGAGPPADGTAAAPDVPSAEAAPIIAGVLAADPGAVAPSGDAAAAQVADPGPSLAPLAPTIRPQRRPGAAAAAAGSAPVAEPAAGDSLPAPPEAE
jgi:OOP family OmpA-OmpF porin